MFRRSRFGIFNDELDKDGCWAVDLFPASSKFQEKPRPPMVCCTSSPMVSTHQGLTWQVMSYHWNSQGSEDGKR